MRQRVQSNRQDISLPRKNFWFESKCLQKTCLVYVVLAQLVERRFAKAKVGSSTLLYHSIDRYYAFDQPYPFSVGVVMRTLTLWLMVQILPANKQQSPRAMQAIQQGAQRKLRERFYALLATKDSGHASRNIASSISSYVLDNSTATGCVEPSKRSSQPAHNMLAQHNWQCI